MRLRRFASVCAGVSVLSLAAIAPMAAQTQWNEIALKPGTYREYAAPHRTDTEQPPNTPGTLIFYRKAMGGSENGALTAPFEGHHGWYLKNDTDKAVTVRLILSGFYGIVPGQIPN